MTSAKHPMRIRTNDIVEVVRLDQRTFQFLYGEGDAVVHVMDPETFEQMTINRSLFGSAARFLQEGCKVTLEFHDGNPISGFLQPQIGLKVIEAEPSMKGEAVTAQFKRAVVETGATVQVPPFVASGDIIVIDTVTGEFVKRG